MNMNEAIQIIEALQHDLDHPTIVDTMEHCADNLKSLTNEQLAAYMIVTDGMRRLLGIPDKLNA